MPTTPARVRYFLKSGRAVVVRRFPFTIRLKRRVRGALQSVLLKIDPGAKTTGMALTREREKVQYVLHLSELHHRGEIVHRKLLQRAQYRRRRRSKNLRYRQPRFLNRRRKKGWLPPSLGSRLESVLSFAQRYAKWAPISRVVVETVRFDMQKLQNPEITKEEYQRGTLYCLELREYLLEKWGRKCLYCKKEGIPLEVEHFMPLSKGGTNRPGNLGIACRACNQKKGSRPLKVFLAKKLALLQKILKETDKPLSATAAVNATRTELLHRLKQHFSHVESSTGGQTKFNRTRLSIPKTHALDAAATGDLENLLHWQKDVLNIQSKGRGSYQRTRVNKYGFPRGFLTRKKNVYGFQTGDLVKASVPKGKKAGTHVGRVAVRASGSFNIQNATSVQGIAHKHCQLLQRADGYNYFHIKQQRSMASSPWLKPGVSAMKI